MSEITVHPKRGQQPGTSRTTQNHVTPRPPKRPNYNAIHRNLLPVQTYPLPPLIPHNPLSLVTIALSYLVQVLAPPKRKIYRGYFSSATSSIHITDEETKRALWEQGFFGRGSLSRSEPTWLENQRKAGSTAEENTEKRRKERRQFKVERAKAELNDADGDLPQKSDVANSTVSSAPDDSLHLSHSIQHAPTSSGLMKTNDHDFDGIAGVLAKAPAIESSPLDRLEALPSALPPKLLEMKEDSTTLASGPAAAPTSAPRDPHENFQDFEEWKKSVAMNGLPTPPPTSTSSEASQAEQARPTKRLQRQKTVRFSPTIEAREFDLSSPVISPIKAPGSSPAEATIDENKPFESPVVETRAASSSASKNQEHLQISMEEAFFLSYSLGVLDVYPSSDETTSPLPTTSLLSLFRRYSYFPANRLSISSQPDDPFMISYAVYHHYRSMGWVVRSGIKFGVDYLLYNRGPAFSHAEFAVVVLPSYTDGRERGSRTWWWLHGVNRVQAQVHKSLLLSYVDVPDVLPKALDGSVDIGVTLRQYKVRDINVKRWTPNRSRD